MATYTAPVGAATLRLDVSSAQNQAGNYSNVSWALYLICSNGLSWNANPVDWSTNIGGHGYSGTYSFDFRGTSTKLIATGTTPITHNAAGNAGPIGVSGTTAYTGTSAIGGPGTVSGSFALPRIPKPPGAPAISAGTVTGRSVPITVSVPAGYDEGGSSVTSVITQYSLNGGAWAGTKSGGWGTRDYTALAPGSYVFRGYAVNAIGSGATASTGTIDIRSGGRRYDGSDFSYFGTAKRFDGTSWVDILTAKRFDGTSWVDLS